ncbi:type III-B CRISPR-associated protein Cas10/Cmr2 [Bacilliculturomica massiliensis]|uniref:type III-B CRISPR-associated protein Cas10/Cmr2 n=1 Tax=Bacilliculturomica massiliensis TaxID=1917867 RepID=UPI00103036DD|nr:type III-B CRISPR-associated protein Cas10/Cmr2 [Bacilliculturomica massiliensis]
MNYLFIFTIGPVQSFIENSRKARDMYAGSKLLSQLMEGAVRELQRGWNADVVFPLQMKEWPEKGQNSGSNMPNRLIAKFRDKDEETLKTIASSLEASVRGAFLSLCRKILQEVQIGETGLELSELQLKDFLEVYWMYEKYEDGDYAGAYQRLFSGINAVKGIRPFEQTGEPWGRSCILFPEYNAIFAKRNLSKSPSRFPHHVNQAYVYDITENQKMRYRVKPGEAMSAIALVKRMYPRPEADIYSIRLMLLKSRLGEDVVRDLDIQLSDGVSNALYDLANDVDASAEEYRENELCDAQKLYRCIKKQNIKLASYYALVKFDGDSMGETFIKEGTEAKQKELSKKIGNFAQAAPGILLRYGGLPVFAGGEDFFGFLPLDTLFNCMQELRTEFLKKVGLTFSAGIVIAHLMQPLKEVVAEADVLEKAAKRANGKNAFVLGVMKRSGERVHMPPYKMDRNISHTPCLADVAELTALLKDGSLSRSLFFNISRLLEPFRDSGKMPQTQMAELLIQGCVDSAALDFSQPERRKLMDDLMKFYGGEYGTEGFLNVLNAISFVAREVL